MSGNTMASASAQDGPALAALMAGGPANTLGTRLSRREREVLALLAEGASNLEIAAGLFISVNTVERHVVNICAKLGARGRTAAVARAIRSALI